MTANSLEGNNPRVDEDLRHRLVGGMFESAMDAILTVDSDQRVVMFNPAAEKMFGMSAEEAVGQSLDRFIPERFREEHRRMVEEFARTGVSARHMGALGVVRGLRADGGQFPAEASISLAEAEGQRFYTAIVRDVSEREEADLTRRRLAAIVENSEDAILSKNLHGIITSWNASAERLFGYTAGEILGQSIMCLVPEDRQTEEESLLEQLRLGQRVAAYETIRLDRAGQRIEVLLTLSPLRNTAGHVIGASSIARDIRQRVQMEQALKEGERTAHRQLAELRNIYQCAPVGLAFLDNDLRLAEVNEQLSRITGRSQEELLGRHVHEALPEVASQLEPLCRRVLETEVPMDHVEVLAPGWNQGRASRRWMTSYYPIRNSLLWGLNLVVSEISEQRRAEKGRSELRFDAFMAHLPGAAWLKNFEGRYVYVNPEAERVFGKPAAEIMGRLDSELFPPETARQFCENDRRALAEGGVQIIEVLARPNGVEHHALVTKFVVPDNSNSPRVGGVAFDITEHVRTQKELSELRVRLAADLDGLKRVQELSKRFVRLDNIPVLLDAIIEAAMNLTGAKKGTIQLRDQESGSPRVVVHRGFRENAFPNCMNCVETATGDCANHQCSGRRMIIRDVSQSHELAGTLAQQMLLAAGVRAMICNPLICHIGRLVGMLSLHFDAPHQPQDRELDLLDILTRQAGDFIERTEAERALREIKDQLSLAVETAQLGTYERDILTNQVRMNDDCRAILGISEGPPPPDVAFRSVYPEDQERVNAAVAQAFDPSLRTICAAEFRIRRPDGTVRWVAGRGRVVFDDSVTPSKAGKFLGVLNDITERKLAEQELLRTKENLSRANSDLERRVFERTAELRETVAELEQISYSMIHDLRAPLRAIRSFGGIIAEDSGNRLTEESRQLIENIRSSVERMDHLVRDVLNYNRVLHEQLPAGPVDAGTLARGIVEAYPNLQSSGAVVKVTENFPPVIGNIGALTQCLSQLLDNAVKFTKPGETPKIQVRGEKCGTEWVRITVEDDGIGIAPELRDKVFGMFQRLSNTGEGTGMGLAIVKKAVERMGGRVGTDSEPGVGCRFWIELKAA